MPSAELAALLDLPKMPTKVGQRVLETIVADAIVSARLYPNRRISYSRRAQHWADRARYAGLGFNRTNITLAVDKLVEKGILVDHDQRPPGRRGIQSSYRPSRSLAALAMPTLHTEKGETIILKDAEGNMVAYKDTPETRGMRYTLSKINGALELADIRIDRCGAVDEGRWTRIDDYLVFTKNKSLHRIFNRSWTLGGRYYGAFWQNMRSDDRRHIVIDGMETVEVDYDQLHARMIYARARKRLRGDAYQIAGWDRKIVKRAFFILINAGNFYEAKGAVANLLFEKGLNPERAGALIGAIKARHRDVSEFIHSGCGLDLQYLDAQMVEYVLDVMTVSKGIPCLPVHDSFIVPATESALLVRVMKRAYEKFVGKASGDVCSIKHPPRDGSVESRIYAPQVHTFENLPSSSELPVLSASLAASSLPSAYSFSPLVAGTAVSSYSTLEALASPHSVIRVSAFPSRESSTSINEVPPSRTPIPSKGSDAPDRVIRHPKMPTFLRRAQEESARAWREEQERKRVREESRQRARQTGPSGRNPSNGMPDREQSVPLPEAGRYAEVSAAVLDPALTCANARGPADAASWLAAPIRSPMQVARPTLGRAGETEKHPNAPHEALNRRVRTI